MYYDCLFYPPSQCNRSLHIYRALFAAALLLGLLLAPSSSYSQSDTSGDNAIKVRSIKYDSLKQPRFVQFESRKLSEDLNDIIFALTEEAEAVIPIVRKIFGVEGTVLIPTHGSKNTQGGNPNYTLKHGQGVSTKYGTLTVYGASLILRFDKYGNPLSASARLLQDSDLRAINFDVPVIPREQAEQLALAAVEKLGQKDSKLEIHLSQLVILEPQLVFSQLSSQEPRITYSITVNAGSLPLLFPYRVFIDAREGKVIAAFPLTRFIDPIDRKILDCSLWNVLPPPYDQYCWWGYPMGGYVYGCAEGSCIRPVHPRKGNHDTQTLYNWLGFAHDYYGVNFNRNGGNDEGGIGSGGSVALSATNGYIYVEEIPAFTGLCPDAWFSIHGYVIFCNNMVTPNVVGHEYAHSVTFNEFHDPLTGDPVGPTPHGQTGSLDEAFADIFGAMLEIYKEGETSWVIGQGSALGPVRNLSNPAALISPITGQPYPVSFHHPNFYCGELDLGGRHINSTVPSYAAYLIANGGSLNGCEIQGIGSDKLEQIWYLAATSYFVQSEDFNGAYLGLLSACYDLYGEDPDCWEVTKALRAVQMDQPGLCSGDPPQPAQCADCTDTDGGNKPYQRGTVTYKGTSYQDACELSYTLKEYYCQNDQIQAATYNCRYGCVNGACRNMAVLDPVTYSKTHVSQSAEATVAPAP